MKVVKECFDDNDELHSINDEPALVQESVTSVTRKRTECWYSHGKLHRDNGLPAKVVIVDDAVLEEYWFENDCLHRVSGPAVFTRYRYRDNQVREVKYYQHGKLHRVGYPAVFSFTRNGHLNHVKFYTHNALDSLVRPGIIEYYLNGSHLSAVKYYKKGRVYRKDGPAVTEYYNHYVKKEVYRGSAQYGLEYDLKKKITLKYHVDSTVLSTKTLTSKERKHDYYEAAEVMYDKNGNVKVSLFYAHGEYIGHDKESFMKHPVISEYHRKKRNSSGVANNISF